MYLKGLPEYLQHDLDAFIKGYTENSRLMDCYYCELQASINSAEVDKEISSYHANYLRYHILGQDLNFMKGNPHFDEEDYKDFID